MRDAWRGGEDSSILSGTVRVRKEENLERANRSIKRSTEENAAQRGVVATNVKRREVCGCLE
jgi:hypothetical protein